MTSPFSYQKYGAASPTSITVLLGSASGLHNDTAEIQTAYTSKYIGEIVTRITHSKRPVSFRIPVSASTPADLDTAIRSYCTMFTPSNNPAKLIYTHNTTSRYLSVYPSGTPDVEYQSNTVAFLTVNLVAGDPYWYDNSTPVVYSSTVTNNGDYPAPVQLTVTSTGPVTLSVNGNVVSTISRRNTSQSIANTVIYVDDKSVYATQSNLNVLNKFDISSQWFMVPVGTSVIAGASNITIKQRWSAP